MSRSIEGRTENRRILLPIRILRASPSTEIFGLEVLALLDTGSTTTGISDAVAQALSLRGRGKRPIGSVQGEGQAERYAFRVAVMEKGSTLPFIFNDLIGFELVTGFAFQALIGMDILSQCDFSMERGGRWSLAFG
jgi:predicted aspartyl protease